MHASAFEEHLVRLKLVSVVGKEVIELIHEEIDKEISGKSVNIAVRMLKPELDQFMKGLNKAVQAPAKTAGKAVVNKIHPTSGRQSIKTLIKQGQGVSSIPLADEGLRDFQKIARKYGVDFAVVRDREKSPPLSKYGRLRQRYLREHKRVLYFNLLTSGKLYEHLAEIDTSARDMVEYLIKEMAKKQGVTEELKATDMMRWIGLMNNIRACADEIVLNDIVYS